MTTSLVTGASGFIGRALAERLIQRGQRVVCLVRKTSRVEPLVKLGVELRYGDVTDPSSLSAAVGDVETIYHVAGAIAVRRPEDFHRINAQGTADLARAAAERPTPPTMVFISSLAAAGPTADPEHPRTEDQPPEPISFYGRSKWEAERMLDQWASRMPISVVRPPIVYGPGDAHLLHAFRGLLWGWHFVPTRKVYYYSLVHVNDLVDAIILTAERGRRLTGPENPQRVGTYFAAGTERATYAELGLRMAEAMGRQVKIWRMREPVARTIATIAEFVGRLRGKPSVFNRDKMREVSAGNWLCSIRRAAEELDFAPRYSIAAGMEETVARYRQDGWLP